LGEDGFLKLFLNSRWHKMGAGIVFKNKLKIGKIGAAIPTI